MHKLTFVIPALLMAGCSALEPMKQDSNREWTAVSCSGFIGWEACHQKAKEACPAGYEVANREENLVEQQRTMRYSCKR